MQSNDTWKSRPTGLRASEAMDRATWSRMINSHTGDPISSRPTRREQRRDNMKMKSQSESESEMYLFDPHKKFIQRNNDNI